MQVLAAALVFIGTMILSATSSGADVVHWFSGRQRPGGGFAVYGQAVADTLLETDPTLKITLQATGGSTQNIPLLEAGKLDLGLVEGTTAYEALEGIGRPPADLRLVAAMYPSPGMFVVRADSELPDDPRSARSTRRLRRGNLGLVVLARYVLDGLGLDLRGTSMRCCSSTPPMARRMVLSGEAAALWGAGIGWPGFAAVARGPQGARFIGPEPSTTLPASRRSTRS